MSLKKSLIITAKSPKSTEHPHPPRHAPAEHHRGRRRPGRDPGGDPGLGPVRLQVVGVGDGGSNRMSLPRRWILSWKSERLYVRRAGDVEPD